MSLRQEMLKEIKSILEEQYQVDPKSIPYGAGGYQTPPEKIPYGTPAKNKKLKPEEIPYGNPNEYKKLKPEEIPYGAGGYQTPPEKIPYGTPANNKALTPDEIPYGTPPYQTRPEDLPYGTPGKASAKKPIAKKGMFDIGSKGPQVKEIQTILATQGFDDELRGNKAGQLTSSELANLADGIFGKRTAESVKLFQKDMGLPVTGYVDQKTYEAIKKMGMGQNITTAKTPAPVSDKVAGAPRSPRTGLEESKNWADRTRESASANLFERLVKDASKKKII